jgi:hypothetical protein
LTIGDARASEAPHRAAQGILTSARAKRGRR